MATKKKKPQGVGLSFAAAKLLSSGITEHLGVQLGMSVAVASTWHPSFNPIRALKIPYHDLDGNDSGFYRIRYLEDLPGFGAQLAKPQRYAQEPDSLNWVYLPKLGVEGPNWAAIAADSSQAIIITEGELKAICGCLHGFLTIALGGVSVWQSKKKGVPLLPPLDKFNWKGRRVTIVFDSDAASNQNVAAAQLRLADELLRLGAVPQVATLEVIDGKKVGLDDFLVQGGDLGAVLSEARSTQLGKALVDLNRRFAYVQDQDVCIEVQTMRRIKRDGFVNGLLANNRVIEYKPVANGPPKRVECVVPSEWLKWSVRQSVGTLVYQPAAPRITASEDFNLWRGWGVEPAAGPVTPWTELLDFLFEGSNAERTWFEKWCAYPLQNPGVKMYSAAVIWGPETGTGKSLVGYTLGRIYGENFTAIGNDDLHSPFNEWAVSKQFIMGEEITGSNKRHEADKLKSLITQQRVRINMKHLPTYETDDCTNYYFNSNHPDAFFLDDQDRRYFVHRVPNPRREREFYQGYMAWLNNGGSGALFHHLLNLDASGFDPAAPAMETSSKGEMVDHARSDVSDFVSNLMRNIDTEMERLRELYKLPSTPDLVLNRHIKQLYDPDNSLKVTSNGLGRELSRHGLKTLAPVLTKTFGKQRFYIMKNTQKWLDARIEDVRDHVDGIFGGVAAPKKSKF